MVSASPHPHANGVFVIVCYFFFCSLNFTTPCFFVPIHVLDKPPKKATVLIQLLSTAGTGFFYTARKIHGLYNVNLRFENTTLLYEDMCCLKRKNCPLVKSDNKNGHKKTNHPSPTTYRVCTTNATQ